MWQALFAHHYKNAALNKYVFSPNLKLANEGAVFMVDGRVFHKTGNALQKLELPTECLSNIPKSK